MGLSSSKSTTRSDQSQTGTTTPITPAWLLEGAQDYVRRIGDFGDSDPNAYVAGASPLQQAAWSNAARLGGWQPQAAAASALAWGAGTGGPNLAGKPGHAGELPPPAGAPGLLSGEGYAPPPSMPGYAMPRTGRPIGAPAPDPNPALTGAGQMGAYANPFDQQVIDTSLAAMDLNAGQVRAAQEAAAARNHAFGGSRYAIQQAMTEGELARARAAQEAQLRQAGFNAAAGLGMQDAAAGNRMMEFNAGQADNDAGRRLQAASVLGDLAGSYDASTRADLGLMNAMGADQRSIEQAYALAPLAQLQSIGSLSGMTPYEILVGRQVDGASTGTNVTKSTPSLFDQLLSAANSAARFL
jgi:hypothetical protein